MFKAKRAFSGFSVDDLGKAKTFYAETLGLAVEEMPGMGMTISLPGGGSHFVYDKPDHQPATYTALNFQVDDIDQAVDELASRGVKFERSEGGPGPRTDAKGIVRSGDQNPGPSIAWFKDPAGNFMSVLTGPE
jgi:catechol 2,3-dioxygenase-like lactoylglutathione lyase family enzyme